MLGSSLFALLTLATVAFAQNGVICSGLSQTVGIARRATPSGCTVRCNPTGINGRVLTLQDTTTYAGEHYICKYDVPAGGSLISCGYHNHNYEDPNYSNKYYSYLSNTPAANCPATLQKSCGGSAYAKRANKRKPLDALLKREKMVTVPAALMERKKVWGRGKKA